MSPSDPPFPPRRRHMANRRPAITLQVKHRTHAGKEFPYLVTVGLYGDQSIDIGEIFINTAGKAGSDIDTMVSDAAVAVSLALQYGCPLEVLRSAMKRNPDGSPTGLMSHALDEASKVVRR